MHINQLFDLSGKVAVVTGGSVGLGAQMATALAEAGANVVVAARKVQRCVDLCHKLEQLGVKALPAACDVAKQEDRENLINFAVKEFGKVDILLNNAGTTFGANTMYYPLDKWQDVLNVNLTGTFHLSILAARVMKEKGKGKIINTTSVAGFVGSFPEAQSTVAYNVSKGGLNIMIKDLAVKWGRYNINVNGIAPGYFPTEMTAELLEQNSKITLPRIPLRRYGNDHDLKGAIVFLSSPASDYITGQVLIVDGGRLAT